MTIYNPDGTPYATTGLTQFDPENPDHALFNEMDSEEIKLFGSPLFYYELFVQFQTVDKLYLEDRGKIWANRPIQLYGYYEPIEPQNPSTAFGIDGVGDVMFECNAMAVRNAIGHMPKRGSRIQTPHLNEFWVLVDIRLTQFQLWGALHVQLIAEKWQESISTHEGQQNTPDPQYKIPIY